MLRQGVCQREGACGKEAGVPEAPQAAADRAGADGLPGVDLQSRSVVHFILCQVGI